MPNLAATETSGAAIQRTRTLSSALFFLIIACGIVYIAIHLSADLGPVGASSVLSFALLVVALSAGLYWALHGLF
ncbi:phosphate transporter [Burkholderia pyrrocinia]|uniref:Phosphate transporter n=1 Tax=Burkholderia pyrrocinia TaxID=60550 RepID=A0A2Z5N0B9_BURPY|nr:phosphate transporter [Burkholderia pyrrocinia]AXF23053.1 phosphate transporter [Burkholderia pyrrocinia]